MTPLLDPEDGHQLPAVFLGNGSGRSNPQGQPPLVHGGAESPAHGHDHLALRINRGLGSGQKLAINDPRLDQLRLLGRVCSAHRPPHQNRRELSPLWPTMTRE